MNDIYETEIAKPDAAQLEASKAEIAAFRAANPTLTKTGLAVAFVEVRGVATAAELHTLLELEPDEYVSVALSSAVQNDRLTKDGKNWYLGSKVVAYQGETKKPEPAKSPAAAAPAVFPTSTQPKPDPQPAKPALQPQKPALQPEKGKPPVDVPSFLKSTPQGEQPLTTRPPRYRFAIWSDGQLEIARQNMTPVTMTTEDIKELLNFLAKVGAHS